MRLNRKGVNMQVYLVITVFQGVFDSVEAYATMPEAEARKREIQEQYENDADLDVDLAMIETPKSP
jgi:hypothetical protein